MAKVFGQIAEYWGEVMLEINESNPWIAKLNAGEIDISHYCGALKETYHYAGNNPQIQAFCTMFFPENERKIIKMFYKHAISEIGHDLVALEDLIVLGVNKQDIINSKPLPETAALNAYILYMIQFKHAFYYLGYLFHLEYMPVQTGRATIEKLVSQGIPKEATKFLEEHSTIDIAHNKMMEVYLDTLIKTEGDLEMVKEGLYYSARLHTNTLASAFENGEREFCHLKKQ